MSIWERYAHIRTSNGYQIDLYKNDLMYKHTARLADSAHLDRFMCIKFFHIHKSTLIWRADC